MDSNRLIAHRGDNTNYPENTFLAIEEALKAGAKSFEFDVQMNADHSLVAFHDEDFLRMTGDNKTKIYDIDDKEMSLLSVHEPKQFELLHFPTKVIFVDDVLELLKAYPEAQVYVEIKDESLSHWGVDFVMDKLLQKLKGFEKQAIIISFNIEALEYTKAHSDLRVGLVFEEYSARIKEAAENLKPEFMICDYNILPEGKVWAGNWRWVVYTVNEVDIAKRLLKRGDIEFVETDDIQLLLQS